MVSNVVLANFVNMPPIGFGTWRLKEGDIAYQAVTKAIEAGYRHIDTAQLYRNEASVGRAIQEGPVAREDLFVTTKVWNDVRGYEATLASVEESLTRLGMDYVDLLLIHWPNPASIREKGPDAWKSANAETWRAFEDLYRQGKAKAIGVSNFMIHHLEALKETAEYLPMVNQIKVAPGVYPKDLIDYCQTAGIIVEAYSPFGSGDLFENEEILTLCQKYQTDPASLALSWLINQGIVPLPRSGNPENIRHNLLTETLAISLEDAEIIANLPGMTPAHNPDEADF